MIDEDVSAPVSSGFDQARPLPPSWYRSGAVAAAERRHVFASSWTCVCRTADLPDPGDWVAVDIPTGTELGVLPVLVVRQDDGTIRAFENACAHRSAMLVDGCGHAERFTCPYHAWVFRRDGRLVGAPHMGDRLESDGSPFEPARHRLAHLRVQLWQGFVHVNPDPDAARLDLDDLDEVVERYGLADYVPAHVEDEEWNTNWKCLVENFMDAYHVVKVHRNTFGGSAATTVYPGSAHSTHHVAVDDENGEFGVAAESNRRLAGPWRHSTVLAAVWPTHLMQIQPDWLWHLQLRPLGVDRVAIRWSLAIAPDVLAEQADERAYVDRVLDLLRRVNAEDRVVVEGVMRGLGRLSEPTAPMSHLERNVYDFHRYLKGELGME